MKYFFALIVAIAAVVPSIASATEPAVYAESLVGSSALAVYQPFNALGSPDDARADFREKFAYVTVDMGADGATGDLSLFYRMLDYGASYQVVFLDGASQELASSSGSFEAYSTQTSASYSGTDPYRYVKIVCVNDHLWSLDAVSATRATTDVPAETAEPAEETQEQTETSSARGMLVKLVDDGDPATTVDAAVYEIGNDGARHAFPSQAVYDSWYRTFDDIAYIDPDNLAAYPLGGNVTVRPGTKLVKIQSDPKVYAVGTDASLHWITSEELARGLYGNDWSDRVIDIPDTSWGNYTVGDPVTTEIHPDGTVGALADGSVVYLGEETVYTFGGNATVFLRVNADNYVRVTDSDVASRPNRAELTEDPNIAYPY